MTNSWIKTNLGSIASFTYGYTASAENDGDVRFLRITDIDDKGYLKDNDAKYITLTKDTKKYLLKNEDILVVRTGSTFGKTFIYRSNQPAIFASFLIRINVNANIILPHYYFQFAQSDNYWMQAKKIVSGGGQPQFNANVVKKIKLLIPTIKEQKQIISALSTWDEAIEKTEKLIELKEKKFKSISNDLLFGKNYKSTKATKWFNLPNHWKLLKIKDVAKEVKEKNGTHEDIPVFSCTKYDGLVDSLKYFDKRIYSEDTSQYKIVKKGWFAYATNHIEEGSIGYQDLYPCGLVSPMYTVFKTNNTIDDGYLYKLLKTETFRHIFEVNTSASVDRRGSLRWNYFSKLPIPFPPFEEQIKINTTLQTSKAEIDLLKNLLEAFKTQKRGLMQKLLTGKWQVKVNKE